MNIKGRLRMIAQRLSEDRRVGYTTLTAKMARDLGAIMLTHNFDDAKRVEREHEVPTKSIDVNLEGVKGPFVIDHFAVTTLLLRAADKIESLELELVQEKERRVAAHERFVKQSIEFKALIERFFKDFIGGIHL